jgi:hypothetical protein
MKIPNADSAIIDPQKIAGYVLNAEHRRGGSKASLLLAFGYDPANWQRLADDLRRDHLSADVDLTRETTYGMRGDPDPIGAAGVPAQHLADRPRRDGPASDYALPRLRRR